jgi:hypothetical protein
LRQPPEFRPFPGGTKKINEKIAKKLWLPFLFWACSLASAMTARQLAVEQFDNP